MELFAESFSLTCDLNGFKFRVNRQILLFNWLSGSLAIRGISSKEEK